MDNETNLIEPLKKNTSQLADWQFREIVVEKINEVIVKLNQVTTFIDYKDGNDEEEAEKAEAQRLEEEKRAEEERAAKELGNQNESGSQE